MLRVDYPAGEDWPPSASAGAGDANAHVQHMAANCPDTKLVPAHLPDGQSGMPVQAADFVASRL